MEPTRSYMLVVPEHVVNLVYHLPRVRVKEEYRVSRILTVVDELVVLLIHTDRTIEDVFAQINKTFPGVENELGCYVQMMVTLLGSQR